MSASFTYPKHYSQTSTEEAVTQSPSSGSLALHAADPHAKPAFDSLEPPKPILYLPPLLSSLPAGSDHQPQDGKLLQTETRLPSIDPVSLSLHKALHKFTPLDAEYANQMYSEAFNWSNLQLPLHEQREWYCVVFRSLRKAGSDGSPLYEADKKAHEEAVSNGGLIMYWYGTPHPVTGLNLATCIWQSRAHAIAGISGPHHIQAMKLAAQSYERYDLERWVLRKVAGEAELQLEKYTGGDVGW